MNYIRTWSSFHAWHEQHPTQKRRDEGGTGDIVDEMFDDMKSVEPDWVEGEGKEVKIEWGSGLLLARRK